MGKFILLTLGAFLLIAASLVSGYFYIQGLSTGQNPWYLLFIILICISLAAFCMLKASSIKNPFFTDDMDNAPLENDPSIATTGLQNAVEKNNAIVSEWRKTNHMKDKMTMIKVSTNAQQKR